MELRIIRRRPLSLSELQCGLWQLVSQQRPCGHRNIRATSVDIRTHQSPLSRSRLALLETGWETRDSCSVELNGTGQAAVIPTTLGGGCLLKTSNSDLKMVVCEIILWTAVKINLGVTDVTSAFVSPSIYFDTSLPDENVHQALPDGRNPLGGPSISRAFWTILVYGLPG